MDRDAWEFALLAADLEVDMPVLGVCRGAQMLNVLREVATESGRTPDADGITETAGAAFFGAIAGAGLEWLLFHPEQPLESVVDQVLLLTVR